MCDGPRIIGPRTIPAEHITYAVPGGVPPSPIVPTEPVSTADRLLAHLRSEAIRVQIPGREFADLIPTIEREVRQTLGGSTLPASFRAHETATAIGSALAGLTPHIQPPNGPAGEFNRVLTFSVPANSGNLNLSVYGVEAPNQPFTGPFWINDVFNPNRTNSIRHYHRYEVHVRRQGDELVYTVALTHGFVGGMRVQVGGHSFLILSHPPNTPPPRVQTTADPPADPPAMVRAPLPTPPMLDAGDLDSTTLASSTVTANIGGLPNMSTSGPLNGATTGTDTVAQGPPPPPPVLPEDSPDTSAPLQLTSNVSARTPVTSLSGNQQLAGAIPTAGSDSEPRIAAAPNLEIPEETQSPGIVSSARAGSDPPSLTPLGSTTGNSPSGDSGTSQLAELPPPRLEEPETPVPPPPLSSVRARWVQRARDLFAELAQTITGYLPSGGGGTDIAGGNPPSPPMLREDGPGHPPSVLNSEATASLGPAVLPNLGLFSHLPGNPPSAGRNIIVNTYRAPNLLLPEYIPPMLEADRAHGLAILGFFSLAPLNDETGALNLRDRNFFNDTVDACYVLPEMAFTAVCTLIAPGEGRRPLVRDSLRSIYHARFGWNRGLLPSDDGLDESAVQQACPRGSPFGADSRVATMLQFLQNRDNRLGAATERDLRTVRARLVSVLRPLVLSQFFVDETRVASAQPRTPGETVPSIQRVPGYNDLVELTRNTFDAMFHSNSFLTTSMMSRFFQNVERLDPANLELVHDFSAQDVFALRTLIQAARQGREHPGFAAMFATSRLAVAQRVMTDVLANPDTRNFAIVEAYLSQHFGSEAFEAQRDALENIVGQLGDNLSEADARAAAVQLIHPFRAQLEITMDNIAPLPDALTRLEAYLQRIQLLLRAQEVADATDHACGHFLMLLPAARSYGGTATEQPPNAEFATRLGAALSAIDGEIALLQGNTIGGSYAQTRQLVLLLRRRQLAEFLSGNEFAPFIQGAANLTLRRRLELHREQLDVRELPPPTPLPPDRVAQSEEVSRLLQAGFEAFSTVDIRGFLERAIRTVPSSPPR